MIWGLKHLPGQERLWELDLVSLEKGRLRGIPSIHKISPGGIRGWCQALFSAITDRMRNSGHELNHHKFHLHMRKNHFPQSDRALEQLPRTGPESPSMAKSKTPLWTHSCATCSGGLCLGLANLQPQPFHVSWLWAQSSPFPTALFKASTMTLSCAPAALSRASPCFVSASLRAGVIISLLTASSFLPAPAAPSCSSCSLCWKTWN